MGTVIEEIQRKTLQYWYEDGLTEIGVGACFVLVSAFFFAMPAFSTPVRAILLGTVFPFLQIGLILLTIVTVQALKRRITYPRTGFIVYRKDKTRKRFTRKLVVALIAMLVAILVDLILGWSIASGFIAERWLTAITGAMVAIVFLSINLTVQLRRIYLLAGWVVLCGLLVSLLNLSEASATPAFLFLVGLGSASSGGICLAGYLKAHPQIRLEEEM